MRNHHLLSFCDLPLWRYPALHTSCYIFIFKPFFRDAWEVSLSFMTLEKFRQHLLKFHQQLLKFHRQLEKFLCHFLTAENFLWHFVMVYEGRVAISPIPRHLSSQVFPKDLAKHPLHPKLLCIGFFILLDEIGFGEVKEAWWDRIGSLWGS